MVTLYVGESCVRFRVEAIDVVTYQDWKTAKDLSLAEEEASKFMKLFSIEITFMLV